MGDEYWRNAFRPLLPDVHHYNYGSWEAIDATDNTTACIILETVQAESGVNKPPAGWLEAIRQKCTEVGALMILDEVQAGFGRTGTLWAAPCGSRNSSFAPYRARGCAYADVCRARP